MTDIRKHSVKYDLLPSQSIAKFADFAEVRKLRLYGAQIKPEGLAGEEPARERGLPDGVSVHFVGTHVHEEVLSFA